VDTQYNPRDWQTVASMQTYRGGRAIVQACERAREQLKANALPKPLNALWRKSNTMENVIGEVILQKRSP